MTLIMIICSSDGSGVGIGVGGGGRNYFFLFNYSTLVEIFAISILNIAPLMMKTYWWLLFPLVIAIENGRCFYLAGEHDEHSLSWNFTQWWDERAENTHLYSEPVIFEEPDKSLQQYGDFDKFRQVQYKPLQQNGVTITSSMVQVDQQKFTPKTSVVVLNETIKQYFSKPRHWSEDKNYMRDLRETLKDKFLSYGLKTAFHVFKTEYTYDKMVILDSFFLKIIDL